jgi:cyclopropane fatty-acyl-phospholipid synthase-like methyltransferase
MPLRKSLGQSNNPKSFITQQMTISREDVRAYYDQNTRLFLAFNRSGKADNIHRSLWHDEVKTLEEAQNATNQRILQEIEATAITDARIADLGCGVGASLLYIAPRLKEPAPAFGLTLSPIQARLASQFSKQAHLEKQVLFAEGDFTSVPLANESLDAVYSVESIVHAQEPEKYFQEAGRLLRPGGKLILVDDYQAQHAFSRDENKWLHAFINGWHVPGVSTIDQTKMFAEKFHLQLIKDENLTPYLRLRNLPGPIADLLLFFGHRLPIRHAILPSMLGSMALQQCLHRKIIEYRFLVFEKRTVDNRR